MRYETIPETVEATQQQIVPCKIKRHNTMIDHKRRLEKISKGRGLFGITTSI